MQPVGRRVSVKWPTSMPCTKVMEPAGAMGRGQEDMARLWGKPQPTEPVAGAAKAAGCQTGV
ncbi:hypothetical protein GCM10027195_20490 [Comamonas sediminis]